MGPQHTLSQFAANSTLGGVVDTADVCAASERDLNWLQKQASRNLVKVNRERQSPFPVGESSRTGTYNMLLRTSSSQVLYTPKGGDSPTCLHNLIQFLITLKTKSFSLCLTGIS